MPKDVGKQVRQVVRKVLGIKKRVKDGEEVSDLEVEGSDLDFDDEMVVSPEHNLDSDDDSNEESKEAPSVSILLATDPASQDAFRQEKIDRRKAVERRLKKIKLAKEKQRQEQIEQQKEKKLALEKARQEQIEQQKEKKLALEKARQEQIKQQQEEKLALEKARQEQIKQQQEKHLELAKARQEQIKQQQEEKLALAKARQEQLDKAAEAKRLAIEISEYESLFKSLSKDQFEEFVQNIDHIAEYKEYLASLFAAEDAAKFGLGSASYFLSFLRSEEDFPGNLIEYADQLLGDDDPVSDSE